MATGRTFANRYLILGEAGAGGMGTVHRAVDTTTGQTIALKIMRAVRDDERVRFEREAAILDQLEHPSIVRYVGHGIAADGSCYLAMEWVTGTTLADRLADPGLTLQEAVSIARQIGEALGAAHSRGIVHRDVKPANIMLAGGEVEAARLIDFGVARRVAEVQKITRTGLVVGTPGYMAPEQARGERVIDTRTDLFALGCVLYECVTGRPAFSGDHVTAVRAKIIADEPPPPRLYNSDVPERLERLVLDLLAKDPRRRPDSTDALLVALDRAGMPEPGPRRRGYTASAPTRSMQAHTDDDSGVFLVLTALGGATDATTLSADDASQQAQIRQAGADLGARIEVMSDGRAFAMIRAMIGDTDEPEALDPALRAGRLALAIRSAVSASAPVVLSFAAGGDAFGRAIERAVMLLEQTIVETAIRPILGLSDDGADAVVQLDGHAAEELADWFEVDEAAGGYLLRRER